jgi:hypothetical protein
VDLEPHDLLVLDLESICQAGGAAGEVAGDQGGDRRDAAVSVVTLGGGGRAVLAHGAGDPLADRRPALQLGAFVLDAGLLGEQGGRALDIAGVGGCEVVVRGCWKSDRHTASCDAEARGPQAFTVAGCRGDGKKALSGAGLT